MSSPSQAEYEANERASALRHERRVDAAPLAERKEAQEAMRNAMAFGPKIVAERISWLLAGNYGYGQMLLAKSATKRMNRASIYTQLIGVFEWSCPRAMVVQAWHKLTPRQQAALEKAVKKVIAEHDATADE